MPVGLNELTAHLEGARKSGARGAEVYVEEVTGWRLDREGSGIQVGQTRSERASARVWLEAGRSAAAIGAVSELPALLAQAIERARDGHPDAHGAPVERLSIQSRGLGIDDRRYGSVDLAARKAVLIDAEKASRRVSKHVQLSGFRYEDARTRRIYASTRGVSVEEYSTIYRVSGTVSVTGSAGTASEEAELSGRAFADISTLPFGGHAARRCVELADDDVPVPKGIKVQLEPMVVGRIMACLADAWTVPQGMPSMLDGRHRRTVVHPLIHLLDDGSLPGGARTRSFDARGVPPVVVPLLREGVVYGNLLTPERARAREERPTGHSTLDGGLRISNLTLRRGSRSLSACRSDHGGTFFLVSRVDGLNKVDLATGRYDLRLWGTLQGDDDGVVRGARVTGDCLFDLFTDVVEISSDTDRWSHVDAPGLTLDGIEFV